MASEKEKSVFAAIIKESHEAEISSDDGQDYFYSSNLMIFDRPGWLVLP